MRTALGGAWLGVVKHLVTGWSTGRLGWCRLSRSPKDRWRGLGLVGCWGKMYPAAVGSSGSLVAGSHPGLGGVTRVEWTENWLLEMRRWCSKIK